LIGRRRVDLGQDPGDSTTNDEVGVLVEQRFELPEGDFTDAKPGDLFIRVTAVLFELEDGQVSAAEKDVQGAHAFLVRYAGTRTADMSKLDPRQLDFFAAQPRAFGIINRHHLETLRRGVVFMAFGRILGRVFDHLLE